MEQLARPTYRRRGGIWPLWVALGVWSFVAVSCGNPTQPAESSIEPPLSGPPAPPPTTPPGQAPTSPPGPPSTAIEYIYIASANGSEVVRLARGSWPAWSPDGQKIAFQRDGEIRVIDADGTDERLLHGGTEPHWSPDGRHIAFTDATGIAVMDVDGTRVRSVIRHEFRDDTYEPWDMGVGKPAWSPDGALIAFEHLGDGDMQPAQIFVVAVDGSDVRLLNVYPNRKFAESDPSWSPDGSGVVFWSYGEGIAVTSRNGGLPNTLFANFPTVAYGSKPVFSPDGRSIAFNWGRLSRSPAIWIMGAAGSNPRPLIDNAYDAAWSPDGTRIAFVSTRDE